MKISIYRMLVTFSTDAPRKLECLTDRGPYLGIYTDHLHHFRACSMIYLHNIVYIRAVQVCALALIRRLLCFKCLAAITIGKLRLPIVRY